MSTAETGQPRSRRTVDIVDETFIRADAGAVRELLDAQSTARRAWPDLRLRVVRDRGRKGMRWTVTGAIDGEMEVWLEAWRDGVIVHHFVRGLAARGPALTAARRHSRRWKPVIHEIKDLLEGRDR